MSSTKYKDELTVYLSKEALLHFKDKPKVFIVTSRHDVLSNSVDIHLSSSQEEADTRIIIPSLDASRGGATEFYIQSPDPMSLSLQSTFTMSSAGTHTSSLMWGNLGQVITLGPIVNALGAAKVEALPGFHAFSGSDATGRFAESANRPVGDGSQLYGDGVGMGKKLWGLGGNGADFQYRVTL